jgi:hypothetical protein
MGSVGAKAELIRKSTKRGAVKKIKDFLIIYSSHFWEIHLMVWKQLTCCP